MKRSQTGSLIILTVLVAAIAVLSYVVFAHADSRRPFPGGPKRAPVPPPVTETPRDQAPVPTRQTPDPQLPKEIVAAVDAFEQQREQLDRAVWAKERSAQEHEVPFVTLWDAIRAATDKVAPLKSFQVGIVVLGTHALTAELENQVTLDSYAPGGRTLDQAGWVALLDEATAQGNRLVECEFHHSQFIASAEGPTSTMAAVFHVVNDRTGTRSIIKGPLAIRWNPTATSSGERTVATIDASALTVLTRQGPPAFSELPQLPELIRRGPGRILLYDLDRDGASDIILPSSNRMLRNHGDGTFEARPLLSHPRQPPSMGIIADVTGDGRADLILAEAFSRTQLQTASLVLYRGGEDGRFDTPGVVVAGPEVSYDAPCMTVGDIDGDDDLDLFVAKYKNPYVGGQMPTPYYDANDGFEAHLLINAGDGTFSEGTVAAGLAAKRHRRTYSASFVDMDDDADLDLVVVSDFSGIDLYTNDGSGHFTDATATAIDERSLFGMSHCFADFDQDGKPDLYVTGMSSTTARRLAALGLGRKDFPKHDEMRPKISYGNRMYCRRDGGTLQQPAFKDEVARTGWSWGVAPIDFDNDGDSDVYIANGNISSTTAMDYCTTYWCHDIYTGSSRLDPILDLGFRRKLDQKISWNGFEHNVLLMNQKGARFTNASFLMGTSIEQDCRAVIVDDLDRDGRPDIIVEEDSYKDVDRVPAPDDVLGRYRILKNGWQSSNHWIGVRLHEEGKGLSPIGATITVRAGRRTQVQTLVTGDTFYCQHANTLHFGLGEADAVDELTVRWRNGHVRTLTLPPVDRYHDLRP